MDTVSVVEAKKEFSELMAQVAYQGRRLVIERHGKPMMVWVSMEDMRRLEASEGEAEVRKERRRAALALAASVRERIHAERLGEPLPDAGEMLHRLREERIDDIPGMR
jgi:prevent-host-death family protein